MASPNIDPRLSPGRRPSPPMGSGGRKVDPNLDPRISPGRRPAIMPTGGRKPNVDPSISPGRKPTRLPGSPVSTSTQARRAPSAPVGKSSIVRAASTPRKAVAASKSSSGININPANRGKYTARAKFNGLTVQQQAARDLAAGSGASSTTKKRANFARNAKKWNRG